MHRNARGTSLSAQDDYPIIIVPNDNLFVRESPYGVIDGKYFLPK